MGLLWNLEGKKGEREKQLFDSSLNDTKTEGCHYGEQFQIKIVPKAQNKTWLLQVTEKEKQVSKTSKSSFKQWEFEWKRRKKSLLVWVMGWENIGNNGFHVILAIMKCNQWGLTLPTTALYHIVTEYCYLVLNESKIFIRGLLWARDCTQIDPVMTDGWEGTISTRLQHWRTAVFCNHLQRNKPTFHVEFL